MIRTSIVVVSMFWFVGTASSGLAQTVNGNVSTGNCESGNCGDQSCNTAGSWWQHKQAECDLIKQHADLIAERNDAWPKPFQCYDRQSYHSIFAVMTQRGWQCECTLTNDHFDSQTQELNRAGKAKISGIMTNLPEIARQVHVYYGANEEVAKARLSNVRAELDSSYSAMPTPALALTTYMPHGMNGTLVEDVQKRFVEGLPDPKVPAASASTISGK